MELSEVKNSALLDGDTRTVEVHLHWSSYANGEWSPRESAGISTPSPVRKGGLSSFSKGSVFIHVATEKVDGGGVYVYVDDPIGQAFYLAGRNSAPEYATYSARPRNPFPNMSDSANGYTGSGNFRVTFNQRVSVEDGGTPVQTPTTPTILNQAGSYQLVPCDNEIAVGLAQDAAIGSGSAAELASLIKPVFIADRLHSFFVEPNVDEQTVEEWRDWVTTTPKPNPHQNDPDWWNDLKIEPRVPIPLLPDPIDPRWNPSDVFINPRPHRDWLVNPGTALVYQGQLIGPAGLADLQILPKSDASVVIAAGASTVRVHPSSGLDSASVVVAGTRGIGTGGLTTPEGGLNVISNAGLNPGLLGHFNALDRSGFGSGDQRTNLIQR
jgi:hypothetical protein